MATVATLMTTEELLALPDDMDRWLIAGKLRERTRNSRERSHVATRAVLSAELGNWLRDQPQPRGRVLPETRVRLRRDPDTTVGADLVLVSAGLMARQTGAMPFVDGVPLLVADIPAGRETYGVIHERLSAYLEAGVALVWVVNPHHRTVTIYRPDAGPAMVNVRQELSGEPHLPGLRIPVARLFD